MRTEISGPKTSILGQAAFQHWSYELEIPGVKCRQVGSTFYNVARDFGLRHDMSTKYDTGFIADQDVNQHLLLRAVSNTNDPNLNTIKCCFGGGANPNRKHEGVSTWEHVLVGATSHFDQSLPLGRRNESYETTSSRRSVNWAEAIKIFINNRANPTLITKPHPRVSGHLRLSLKIVLNRYSPIFLDSDAKELQLILDSKRASRYSRKNDTVVEDEKMPQVMETAESSSVRTWISSWLMGVAGW